MASEVVTIDGTRYLAGVTWTEVPEDQAQRAGLRELAADFGETYGFLAYPSKGSGVMVGFSGSKRSKYPSAVMHLASSTNEAVLMVASIEETAKDGSARYWIGAANDGVPAGYGDRIVGADGIEDALSRVLGEWSESGVSVDAVAFYVDDESIAETFDAYGATVASFDWVTAGVAYEELQRPRQLGGRYSPARAAVMVAALGAGLYMLYIGLSGPQQQVPTKPEPSPDQAEQQQQQKPKKPEWRRQFDDVLAALGVLLDRYHAASRMASAYRRAQNAPWLVGGWQRTQLVVKGGEHADLVYQRDGRASFSRLRRSMGEIGSVSFGKQADSATIGVPLELSEQQGGVIERLSQAQGRWVDLADLLVEIAPQNMNIRNVRQKKKGQEEGQALGGDDEQKKDAGRLELPKLKEVEDSAQRHLIERYRWRVELESRTRFQALVERLRKFDTVALELLKVNFTETPLTMTVQGVLFEQSKGAQY